MKLRQEKKEAKGKLMGDVMQFRRDHDAEERQSKIQREIQKMRDAKRKYDDGR